MPNAAECLSRHAWLHAQAQGPARMGDGDRSGHGRAGVLAGHLPGGSGNWQCGDYEKDRVHGAVRGDPRPLANRKLYK